MKSLSIMYLINKQPRISYWIKDENPEYVEEQMYECYLHGLVSMVPTAGQSREQTGGGGADVGAEGEGVGPLQGHQASSSQGGQGGGEHGAALHQHSQHSAWQSRN